MNINWKVRIRNRQFWLAIIPAIALLVQAVAALFGHVLDLTEVQARVVAVVNALFVALSIMGIVTDPTTEGLADSELAMTYDEPKRASHMAGDDR